VCVVVVHRNLSSCLAFAALTLLMATCQNPATPPDTTPPPTDPYVPPVQLVVERAADIDPSGDGSPAGLTVYGGALYFSGTDAGYGTQLWSYNGSAATRVTDINSPTGSAPLLYPTVFNEGARTRLYFRAFDGAGSGLYAYDGSSAVTIAGLNLPQYMTVYNGALYMGAYDTVGNGEELWSYDGATATPRADINTGAGGSSFPSYLTVFNGKLYFRAAADGVSYKLWQFDGSSATVAVDVGVASHGMKVYNGALYFCATDGANGYELWRYDGVTVPTGPAADINSGAGDGLDPTGGKMAVFNGKLYFRAAADGASYKLYEYDGSAVRVVSDTGVASSDMVVYGSALYYSGNDGVAGWEPWSYDGAAVGLVKDINPGAGSSNPQQFAEYGGRLYFQADDGVAGAELWRLYFQ
jgi:ELWxxDGT repeat protein